MFNRCCKAILEILLNISTPTYFLHVHLDNFLKARAQFIQLFGWCQQAMLSPIIRLTLYEVHPRTASILLVL
jgi:hypothetical protein